MARLNINHGHKKKTCTALLIRCPPETARAGKRSRGTETRGADINPASIVPGRAALCVNAFVPTFTQNEKLKLEMGRHNAAPPLAPSLAPHMGPFRERSNGGR